MSGRVILAAFGVVLLVMGAAGPAWAEMAQAEREAKALFEALDTNRDGRLSVEEFAALEAMAGVSFDSLDKNKDKVLNITEFANRNLAKANPKLAEFLYIRIDKNRDGQVNIKEYSDWLKAMSRNRFKDLDGDDDGFVVWAEFKVLTW